jgi:hypothetical protein
MRRILSDFIVLSLATSLMAQTEESNLFFYVVTASCHGVTGAVDLTIVKYG